MEPSLESSFGDQKEDLSENWWKSGEKCLINNNEVTSTSSDKYGSVYGSKIITSGKYEWIIHFKSDNYATGIGITSQWDIQTFFFSSSTTSNHTFFLLFKQFIQKSYA